MDFLNCTVALNGGVDLGFLGVVKVLLFNLSDKEYLVRKGTRIAQIIFSKTENVSFKFESLNQNVIKKDLAHQVFGNG